MSCVESSGQKAAPEIFTGAEQISPPTKVSKQRDDKSALAFSERWRLLASSPSPAPAVAEKSHLQARVFQIHRLSGGSKRRK